jgi:hypothetical protein
VKGPGALLAGGMLLPPCTICCTPWEKSPLPFTLSKFFCLFGENQVSKLSGPSTSPPPHDISCCLTLFCHHRWRMLIPTSLAQCLFYQASSIRDPRAGQQRKTHRCWLKTPTWKSGHGLKHRKRTGAQGSLRIERLVSWWVCVVCIY